MTQTITSGTSEDTNGTLSVNRGTRYTCDGNRSDRSGIR